MPAVIGWVRLEPFARSVGLDGGLRAEIHDPLWMLARQWQLGEFWGEDAGSPVQARLRLDCTPLTRYLPGGVPASWYPAPNVAPNPVSTGQRIAPSVPLETVVERERVRDEPALRPRLAAEAGLHFQRLLADAGAGTLRGAVLSRFQLQPAQVSDPATQRFLSVMARRVPDGALLASVLKGVLNASTLTSLPEPYKSRVTTALQEWQTWIATLTADDRTRVNTTTAAWLVWYDSLFSQPGAAAGDTSWIPERLEYEFAVSAPTPQRGEVLLTAPEYTEGHLDWYSFDALATGTLGAVRADLAAADLQREAVRRTVIPTPVRYPGMPASRYWEFEDARVDFGALAAGAQQLAQLLLIEFALVSGDDWYVIPVDMPVGSVSIVRWLVVTDTFGDRTLVPSARQVDRGSGSVRPSFDLFNLSPDPRPVPGTPRPAADVFLLPATLGTSLEGTTVEEVLLLRDELANMAWAVERVVESPMGVPFDRSEAFNRSRPQPPDGPAVAPAPEQPRPLKYRLATDVPGHWLPLYPTRARADAPVIRLLRGGAPEGRILEPSRLPASNNPLLIRGEEVPRAGARVTRAYQYARWVDGNTFLWVGRRKSAGRGEGSSGLRFDVLERDTAQG